MKKRILIFLTAALFALALTGCAPNKDENVIQPINKSIKTPTMGIPLYFGYKNLPYLCGEIREVPESYEASIEKLAITELIKGPANTSELYSLIPKGTTVEVSGTGDTLFVTLSGEFLGSLASEDSSTNAEEQAKIFSRRRLAVYSIVNTVTEIGNYSRVQILISDKKNPKGYKPKMFDMGLSSENDGKFTGALSRLPDVILTPNSAALGVFSLIQEKKWEDVYGCLYQGEMSSGTTTPAYDFENHATKANVTIEDYSVTENFTYNDNGVAVVNANLKLRTSAGSTEYTQLPVRVVNSGNIWKVEYSSLKKIFEKVTR